MAAAAAAAAAALGEAEAVVASHGDLNLPAGEAEGEAMEEEEEEEAVGAAEGSPGPGGGRRRAASFQKLWTEADETAILEGFLEFVTSRGTTHADYQHGTAPFFEVVKPRLSAAFSTSQLVEKLRRLKRKYRSTAARIAGGGGGAPGSGRRRRAFVFRSPHDEAAYEISRKIWSPTFKRGQLGRPSSPELPKSNLGAVISFQDAPKPDLGAGLGLPNAAAAPKPELDASNGHREVPKANLGISGSVREAAKEERDHFLPGLFAAGDPLWPVPEASAAVERRLEGRWREQRILELEVFLKRVELVRERVAARLDELRWCPASSNATGTGNSNSNGNGIG